jgi:hypothetical protein
VDEKVISRAIRGVGKSSAEVGKTSTQSGRKTPQGGQNTHPITSETDNSNPQAKSANASQQQLLRNRTDDAVVVDLPSSEPEAESGEYSIDGEGQDATAVKAFMPHEQHQDKEPLSKVPLKVLSPDEARLRDDLIAFGITLAGAQQLIQRYTEDDIRYVMACAQKATLGNPPGFVVRELEKGAAGVLGLRSLQKDLRPPRDPSVVAWEARIQAEMERMVAEDRAAGLYDDLPVGDPVDQDPEYA